MDSSCTTLYKQEVNACRVNSQKVQVHKLKVCDTIVDSDGQPLSLVELEASDPPKNSPTSGPVTLRLGDPLRF